MLANDGYYEMMLWNNHKLQVWVDGKLAILNHPLGCNSENDECHKRLMHYIHSEGILDEVLNERIIMLDSYAEENL